MSRSYVPSDDGYSRHAASSPVSYREDDSTANASTRPMRLKVLYTCDDKTNCMAKWHQVVHVRTAYLDERTEIGVVDLKTCIKSIINCSPELVAKMGQDYTVYAYDYSEYEVPLVGQGMLSWVLSSPSTASASTQDQAKFVTGRVMRNTKALFGGDPVKEILEVKLRLVPVPTILQSEYVASMKRYQDVSRAMPDDFDHQGWTDFLSANPQVLSSIVTAENKSPSQSSANGNHIGIEHVQRLMQTNQVYSQRPKLTRSRHGSFAGSVASQEGSRAGSPTPSMQSRSQDPFVDPARRPASQASNPTLRRTISSNTIEDAGFASNDEQAEEGPARKRARITQVRRPGRNGTFGGQSDSLRVAASAAASIRVLQPTATRPGANIVRSLEDPPRAPTPVPQRGLHVPRRPAPHSRSSLGQVAMAASANQSLQFYGPGLGPDSAVTSPEARSVLESSPGEDPGSSPPVAVSPDARVEPSSPQLPRMLPPHEDSGFMSGTIDEIYEDSPKDPQQSIDNATNLMDSRGVSNVPAKPDAKLRKSTSRRKRADSAAPQMTAEEKAAELSRRNARRAVSWRRIQSWSEGQPPSSEAPIPQSDAVVQNEMPPPLIWPDNHQFKSDQQPDSESFAKSKNAYDRKKQKNLLHSRLANAVENGDMPPFCENCGDINTPTWRKAYFKLCSGAPGKIELSKEPGGVIAVQVVQTDEAGEPLMYKLIKKSCSPDDAGFQDMLLCNPCGLWLVNRKHMRPPERWHDKRRRQTGEPRSGGGRKRQSDSLRSEAAMPSEMTEPPSEIPLPAYESQPSEGHLRRSHSFMRESTALQDPEDEPELPILPEEGRRPLSSRNIKSRSDNTVPTVGSNALQRAVQSSPGQIHGSRHSPIEVDHATPDRTRRVLFPSPKAGVPLAPSNGNKRSSLQNSPDAPKQFKAAQTTSAIAAAIVSAEEDKENAGPADAARDQHRAVTPSNQGPDAVGGAGGAEDDYFYDLFNDVPPPSTPSRMAASTLPLPKSPSDLFKTPTRPTPKKGQQISTADFFSSAARAFLHGCSGSGGGGGGGVRTPSRTPSKPIAQLGSAPETPFTKHINQLLSEAPEAFDMNTSPGALFADIASCLESGTGLDGAGEGVGGGGGGSRTGPQNLLTTDLPMPSSPPVLRKAGGVAPAAADLWSDMPLASSPFRGSPFKADPFRLGNEDDECDKGAQHDGDKEKDQEESATRVA